MKKDISIALHFAWLRQSTRDLGFAATGIVLNTTFNIDNARTIMDIHTKIFFSTISQFWAHHNSYLSFFEKYI